MPVTYELRTRLTGKLLDENSIRTLKLKCYMSFPCTKWLTGNVAVINEIRDACLTATAAGASPSHQHGWRRVGHTIHRQLIRLLTDGIVRESCEVHKVLLKNDVCWWKILFVLLACRAFAREVASRLAPHFSEAANSIKYWSHGECKLFVAFIESSCSGLNHFEYKILAFLREGRVRRR